MLANCGMEDSKRDNACHNIGITEKLRDYTSQTTKESTQIQTTDWLLVSFNCDFDIELN